MNNLFQRMQRRFSYPVILIRQLVITDFKLRYQGSVLGYAWSLLRPLLLFLILYIVFVKFLKIGTSVPHFPIYLLLGIVIWNFFYEMTVQNLGSIMARGDLIRKVRIPRWTIIIATSISALINLCLNLLVVALFMLTNHVILLNTIVYLPLVILEVYILALGLSFFLSAAFVKYRDVSYIWEVIMQAGFYLTPILYPLSRITDLTFQKILMLNPMAQAIQDARYATITHQSATTATVFGGGWYKLIPFITVIVVLFAGIWFFKSQSKFFAENI